MEDLTCRLTRGNTWLLAPDLLTAWLHGAGQGMDMQAKRIIQVVTPE